MVLETALLIAATVAAVAGTGATVVAQKKQNEAQEKAAKLQQAGARIENMHRARRAIAERRMMQAELEQSVASQGARTSSSLQGATGSLSTQTAANIGFNNTTLATDIGVNNALVSGAREAARWNTFAGVADAASTGMGWYGNRLTAKKTAATSQAQINALNAQTLSMQEQLLGVGRRLPNSPAPRF